MLSKVVRFCEAPATGVIPVSENGPLEEMGGGSDLEDECSFEIVRICCGNL